MESNAENSAGFRVAILVEGGLGIAAILLAWLFDIQLRDFFAQSWTAAGNAVLRGCVATLPCLAGFWWLTNSKSPGLVQLQQQVRRMLAEAFPEATLPQLALIATLAGVGEELLFRGVLQILVARWTTPGTGLVIAAVVFGLLHALSRLYFVLATLMGMYLGWLVWRYNDLIAPIVVHTLYDFLALAYLTRANRERL